MSSSSGIKDLRPLALGELVDRSALFWRAHLKPLFLLCLGFELINYIFSKGFMLMLERSNGLLNQTQEQLQAQSRGDPMGVLLEAGSLMLAATGLLIVIVWSYWIATLVIARYVVPIQLGQPMRPVDGLRRGLSRLGSLTGAYLLSLLWGLGTTLLLVLPGGVLCALGVFLASSASGETARLVGIVLVVGGFVLAGVGALGALLWYFLRFSILGPVFAMEELSALGTFRRSGTLLSGRIAPGFLGRVKVRAMILLTAVSGIIIAVSFVFSLPAWIVRAAYGHLTNPSAAATHPIPQALLIPVELFQVLGQSIFAPLALVFSAMFYLDMRVRREGLDLERRLDDLPPTT